MTPRVGTAGGIRNAGELVMAPAARGSTSLHRRRAARLLVALAAATEAAPSHRRRRRRRWGRSATSPRQPSARLFRTPRIGPHDGPLRLTWGPRILDRTSVVSSPNARFAIVGRRFLHSLPFLPTHEGIQQPRRVLCRLVRARATLLPVHKEYGAIAKKFHPNQTNSESDQAKIYQFLL